MLTGDAFLLDFDFRICILSGQVFPNRDEASNVANVVFSDVTDGISGYQYPGAS